MDDAHSDDAMVSETVPGFQVIHSLFSRLNKRPNIRFAVSSCGEIELVSSFGQLGDPGNRKGISRLNHYMGLKRFKIFIEISCLGFKTSAFIFCLVKNGSISIFFREV